MPPRYRKSDEPGATPKHDRSAPVRRELPLERLQRELVVRDIEEAADDYIRLMVRTRPARGTRGWRSLVRHRIDGLATLEDATEMLEGMLGALDDHEFGRADPGHTVT
jgi:hypothetical protein